MKKRENQKAKRKPNRTLGTYNCNGEDRLVMLHPTKGFRDRNITRSFNTPGVVHAQPRRLRILSKENLAQILKGSQVDSNAPEITRKKMG